MRGVVGPLLLRLALRSLGTEGLHFPGALKASENPLCDSPLSCFSSVREFFGESFGLLPETFSSYGGNFSRVHDDHTMSLAGLPREAASMAICSIANNEAQYLEEWIAFHHHQGVERFYILPRNSTDGTTAVLETGADFGVKIFPIDYITQEDFDKVDAKYYSSEYGIAQRIAFMNACTRYAKEESVGDVWVFNINVDEFMLPTEGLETLPEQIYRFQQSGYSVMKLPLLAVGSNRQLFNDGGPVTQRFVYRMSPKSVEESCNQDTFSESIFEYNPFHRLFCDTYQNTSHPGLAVLASRLVKIASPTDVEVESGETWAPSNVQEAMHLHGGPMVFHYQAKSLTEFYAKAAKTVFVSKYQGRADLWFDAFNTLSNEVRDTRAADVMAHWKWKPPPLPRHPAVLLDRASVKSLEAWYGPEKATHLVKSFSQEKQTTDSTPGMGVIMMGMHQTAESYAMHCMLSLGLYAGLPQDLDLMSKQKIRVWQRFDVTSINQQLFNGQARNKSHPSFLGYNFKWTSVKTGELRQFSLKAQDVVAKLLATGMPFVVEDPRFSLSLPLWRPLFEMHAKLTCMIMWRGLQEISPEMLDAYGRTMFSHDDLMEITARYANESISACVGLPTFILLHRDTHDARYFLEKAHSSLQAALPGIEMIPVVEAYGRIYGADATKATKGSAHPASESSDPLTPQASDGVSNATVNLSISALAVQEVMTRFTIGKDGPWDGAEPKELAAVLQREIQQTCLHLAAEERNLGTTNEGGSSSGESADGARSTKNATKRQEALMRDSARKKDRAAGRKDRSVNPKKFFVEQFSGNAYMTWTSSADEFTHREVQALQALFQHNSFVKVQIASDSLFKAVRHKKFKGPLRAIERLINANYNLEFVEFPMSEIRAFVNIDQKSEFANSDLSDVYRYYILHQNGGVYMDFDTFAVNPWIRLPANFIYHDYDDAYVPPADHPGREHYDVKDPMSRSVNTAFMQFRRGHPFLARLLKTARAAYNPQVRSSLGSPFVHAQIMQLKKDGDAETLAFTVMPMIKVAPVPPHMIHSCTKRRNSDCNKRCQENFATGFVFHLYGKEIHHGAHVEKESCVGRILQRR